MCIALTQNRLRKAENYHRGAVSKMRLLDGSHLAQGKVVIYGMKSQRLQLQGLQKGTALQRDLYFIILAFFLFDGVIL